MKKFLLFFTILNLISLLSFSQIRIKDIAYMKGVKGTSVVGIGLVTGLNNTGDTRRSLIANQMMINMLKRFGINIPPEQMQTRNIAAVTVTGTIDPFMKQGALFDVVVSSLGDGTSLQGGTLLFTPLSIIGNDGQVYATAQGPISIGGYDTKSFTGTDYRRNHSAAGRVPNGGQLEDVITDNQTEIINSLTSEEDKKRIVRIIVKSPDFTTASRIAEVVNKSSEIKTKYSSFKDNSAYARDAASISIELPTEIETNIKAKNVRALVDFISIVENLEIEPDVIAKVIINEKTGTIVVGEKVKLLPAAIAHGNLILEIRDDNSYFPIPSPITQGQNVVLQSDSSARTTNDGKMVALPAASTVQDIASALNTLKVTPKDIIAIFQALKEAGSLKAELVIL